MEKVQINLAKQERSITMRCKTGLTMVEILIVVVILGLIAAVVIPQFTEASRDAKISTLAAGLQTMRSQLELYKIHHKDILPGQMVLGGDITPANFITALTTEGADGYGPYIKKIPSNPFVRPGVADDSITFVNDATVSCPGDDSSAWWINAATGEFHANTLGHNNL